MAMAAQLGMEEKSEQVRKAIAKRERVLATFIEEEVFKSAQKMWQSSPESRPAFPDTTAASKRKWEKQYALFKQSVRDAASQMCEHMKDVE